MAEDMDSKLKTAGRDWRRDLASPPSFTDAARRAVVTQEMGRVSTGGRSRIDRGAVRRWRTPVLVAATVAALLGATFATVASHSRDPERRDSSAVSGTAPTACVGGDFSVRTVIHSEVGDGFVLYRAALSYNGDVVCTIESRESTPTLKLAGGAVVTGGGPPDYLLPPAVVRPGDIVISGALWRDNCVAQATIRTMTLSLGATDVSIPVADTASPDCHPANDGYAAAPLTGIRPQFARTGAQGGLVASLVSPRNATKATPLTVHVRLTNVTAASIALDPCPSFRVDVKNYGGSSYEATSAPTYSCAALPAQVDPGQTVDLPMTVDLAGAPSGSLWLVLFQSDSRPYYDEGVAVDLT